MKPHIDDTNFGSITIEGSTLEHDILIRLSGEIVKRKKKLSKAVYGTSHVISREEAKFIYETGAALLIVGSGQEDSVRLSDEAQAYLEKRGCKVELWSTPEAIRHWNRAKGPTLGLFHVTC